MSMIRSVYVNYYNSDFIIIEAPQGIIPPPLHGYMYVSTVTDIFTQLNYHMKQSEIAKIVGFRQQHVSSVVQGKWEPRLDEATWRKLLTELKQRCLTAPVHEHSLDYYRAHVLSPAHRKQAVS